MSLDRIADPPGVVGAEEWLAVSDELLAGLVHTLNNRVAALSACSELAVLGDSQMVEDGVLTAEVERLQRLSGLLALLPARDRPAEALELTPALNDAMQLHAYHPRLTSITGELKSEGAPCAVRAPRWALMRLLVLLVDAAKTAAQEARSDRFGLTISGDEHAVRVWGDARRSRMGYAEWLAALCGGVLMMEDQRLVLTLPSLQELRRRDREARGGAA